MRLEHFETLNEFEADLNGALMISFAGKKPINLLSIVTRCLYKNINKFYSN